MGRITITRKILEAARDRASLTEEEKGSIESTLGKHAKHYTLSTTELPHALLRSLLDDTRLGPDQRSAVSLQMHGMGRSSFDRDEIYAMSVKSPIEFGSAWMMTGRGEANCEVCLAGRWYPVAASVDFVTGNDNSIRFVNLIVLLSIAESVENISNFVLPELFLDEAGGTRSRTVLDVLEHFGFRRLQTSPAEFNLKLARAERTARERGEVISICGDVLTRSEDYWWCQCRLQTRSLATPEDPSPAVIEHELEVTQRDVDLSDRGGERLSRLPFVRAFSLAIKKYVYADVDDVAPYAFDESAMSRLHLPVHIVSILTRVFDTPARQVFGNLVGSRHGGIVILASGNPGVGKTLTAEVYAEKTRRPLYVLEFGELGTEVDDVEENLHRVFTRVERWNAVLQFDECEIFLASRDNDLVRSAIVGIFLRLLDGYRGILFLTTNRPEVIDHAVLSRIMLQIEYPDLDHDARAAVWRSMFTAAGLELIDGTVDELAVAVVNGRQIRNLVRLAAILHPGRQLTLSNLQEIMVMSAESPRAEGGNRTSLRAHSSRERV